MLETPLAPQRHAVSSAPTSASEGAREDERDLSPSLPGTVEAPLESRISRIARRAHEIYQARAGEHGTAVEDWLQAEREIDSELSEGGGAAE